RLCREPGACLLGASAPLGADAPGVRVVLRRNLCGRRELAQSPREPREPRAPARHLHAGAVRRARVGAVSAGAHEPGVVGPLHADLGADLARDGADRRLRAADARARRAAPGALSGPLPQLPLGVVAGAASGLISSIIFSMGPVYARLSGNGPRGVAAFMAVSILAAVLTQYPVGRHPARAVAGEARI